MSNQSLLDGVEWIVDVWIPSLVLAGAIKYAAKISAQKSLEILSVTVTLLVSFLSMMKCSVLLDPLLSESSGKIPLEVLGLLSIVIGIIVAVVSIAICEHLIEKLAEALKS